MKITRLSLLGLFMFFHLFVIAQVNLQTGAAEVSIPLYNYSEPTNKLNTSITLNYTAGAGLLVNEPGELVGAGWNLSFGGEITRIQHGEPDDQKQDEVFAWPNVPANGGSSTFIAYTHYVNNYYPNGFLFSTTDVSVPMNNMGGFVPLLRPNSNIAYKPNPIFLEDREQDEFQFNFNGRTGKFVIGKDGQIKILDDSKLIVNKVYTNMTAANIITRISEFTVIDEAGIKYVFKDYELDEILSYEKQFSSVYGASSSQILYPPGSSATQTHTLYRGIPKNKFVINKWLLKEIINPATNEKIEFNYIDSDVDFVGPKVGGLSETSPQTSAYRDISLTVTRIKGKKKRVTNIVTPVKEKVIFQYSSNPRNDLPFDKQVDEVQIIYDNKVVNKWKFDYGYFVQDQIKLPNHTFTQSEKNKSRLCLLSLGQAGADGSSIIPPYKFDYYIGQHPNIVDVGGGQFEPYNFSVSPLHSFYTDHYGYSLYAPGTGLDDPYLSEPYDYANPVIKYNHIWGFTKNWGPAASQVNGYSVSWRDNYNVWIHYYNSLAGTLKKVTNPYGGTLTYEYERNRFKGNLSTEIDVGGYRVKKTVAKIDNGTSEGIVKEYKYVKPDGTSSGWGYERMNYTQSHSTRTFKCNGGSGPEIAKNFTTNFAKSFINDQYISQIIMPTDYIPMSETVGSAVKATIMSIIRQILINAFTPNYVDLNVNIYSTTPNQRGNRIPFLYSRVEVVDKINTDDNGKTVFEFTSDVDTPIDVPILNVPGSAKPRFGIWSYGLPKSETIYGRNMTFIKAKKDYVYDILKNSYNNLNFQSQKWNSNRTIAGCAVFPANTTQSEDIRHDFYYPIYGRTELKQVKEYVYNSTGQSTETIKNFYYNTNFAPSLSNSTNSKGEVIESKTFYASDYNLPGAVAELKNRNVYSAPVCTLQLITKPNGQKYIVSGNVLEYGYLPNGDIGVIKKYELISDNPILESAAPFNPNQLNPNPSFFKEAASFKYNPKGELIEALSQGQIVSTIYDDDKRPIATVVNASADDIAYTSFENGSFGGWGIMFGQGPGVQSDKFITGKKSFSGALTRFLQHSGDYTVTAWSRTTNISVNNALGVQLATVGEWKLYEWKLMNVNNVEIVAEQMDEVRLYPTKARMTTVTYEPLIGKSSECDASNRIVYYDYDGLGRLKLLRDENRNVIKAYEYNYKQ